MSDRLSTTEHKAFRERLADLLIADGDAADKALLEEHLDVCPDCRQQLTRLRRADALLAAAEPTDQPSPSLNERVSAIPVRAQPERQAPRRRRLLVVGAGAVAAAAIAGVMFINSPRPTAPSFDAPTALAPTRSDVQVAVAMASADGADLPMRVTASGLTPGEEYSLWLTGQQGEVLVETFRPDKVGDCSVVLTAPAGEWSRAVVRWEGSPDEDVIAAASI